MSRRVLIVDQDVARMDGLRRSLGVYRRDWEFKFLASGRDALDVLADDPQDVLITALRTADLPGDELLAEARRLHPLTVRMVTAGPDDRGHLVRLVTLAHRVLNTPFGADELMGTVARAASLRDLLQSPALAAVAGRLGALPTLPALYARIVGELDRPDYSLNAVADLIAQDVGMAAKLIQLTNSALIGVRRPATAPSDALWVLGAEMTKTFVLAASVFARYDRTVDRVLSIDELWAFSQRVSELAGAVAVAERAGDRIVREAALAGLFHDVGRLTLACQLPEPYREVQGLIAADRLTVCEAEQRVFGATHAEVGAYLLGLWGLPDALIEAVAWHHTPNKCPGRTFSALTAVHVADALARAEEGAVPDPTYLDALNLEHRVQVWSRLRRADALVGARA